MQTTSLWTKGFALVLLLAVTPLLIILWAAIKVSNPRMPMLFKQTRIGLNGKPFQIWKIRTMHMVNSIKLVVSKDDKRITRIGRFLRSTHLDEIVQLINILNGTMTFIGPRPLLPHTSEKASATIPRWSDRYTVLPGMTGLYQIMSISGCKLHKVLSIDRLMLKHLSSLKFRLWIAGWTLRKTILMQGK